MCYKDFVVCCMFLMLLCWEIFIETCATVLNNTISVLTQLPAPSVLFKLIRIKAQLRACVKLDIYEWTDLYPDIDLHFLFLFGQLSFPRGFKPVEYALIHLSWEEVTVARMTKGETRVSRENPNPEENDQTQVSMRVSQKNPNSESNDLPKVSMAV